MNALIIGGTGPTGPFLVEGLLRRGYEVSILHRGTHEIEEIASKVEHIHVDPHFLETLQPALAGRTFDLCIATYGRLRHVARALVGKASRFIAIGGTPYQGLINPSLTYPRGEVIPIAETRELFAHDASDPLSKFARLVVEAEKITFQLHPSATLFRYPYIYGPHQPFCREWSIIRRLRDERPYMIVADGGRQLRHHGYAENMAHAILLSVDNPDIASGQIYNAADTLQLSLRQVIEIVTRTVGQDIELISVPLEYGRLAPMLIGGSPGEHNTLDTFKLRHELGYADVVSPIDGFARACEWLMEHPPERGSIMEQSIGDPFDYEAEDRLVRRYRGCFQQMSEFKWENMSLPHAYPHPKKPGLVDERGR